MKINSQKIPPLLTTTQTERRHAFIEMSGYGNREVLLYDIESIRRETTVVKDLCLKDEKDKINGVESDFYWLGKRGNGIFPGEIDCKKMVIIGDFGFDAPICLDFRNSTETPSVLFLGSNGWEVLCRSYEELVAHFL